MTSTAAVQRAVARVLRPFSRVHPHEAATVVLMTAAAFLLLAAYYQLKTVREPLILLHGGAEMKLYLRAAQAVLMVGVVHLYGELARRVGRTKLVAFVFLFFVANLAIFTVLERFELPIGVPFFLWVGVFSYTAVAQLWGLAADIYTEEQGKRLFPVIGAGSSIGAVVGGIVAKSLVPFGPDVLMATAVVILLACVGLLAWIGQRSRSIVVVHAEVLEAPLAKDSAWALLAHDKYLLLIAGMVVLLNWVNSSGEYVLDRTVLVAAKEAATRGIKPEVFVGAFKAGYFAWYNAIGLGLQLFAVSRVLKLVGIRGALFVMPAFALVAYGGAVFFPIMAVMRVVKIGENSLQYSLQDTTRHGLFLIASRVEKFVGTTAVDTLAVRIGAVTSGLVVFVGARLDWSLATFAAIDVCVAAAWIIFVVMIGREHRRLTVIAS